MMSARPAARFVLAVGVLSGLFSALRAADKPSPDWTRADRQPPPTAAETRAFMKRLLAYIEKHHLKTDEKSPQGGMVYEYFDTRRSGQCDQWVQGDALAAGDAALMKHVPDQDTTAAARLDNHSYRALYDFKPGQRQAFPAFADDQQYRHHFGIARNGGKLPRPLAFKTI